MNAKASATKVCPGCSARYPPDALFCPNDGSPLTGNALTDGSFDAGPGSGASAGEPRDPYLGREISGHIEIRDVAGVGAMGRVYRAFQKGIDRDVAVKVLHRELSANQQLVARFHREAKIASRLQHPNVVQVYLAGQLPDGAMYIVMEYLDGISLQGAVSVSSAPFPLQRALHIALQICDAAGEAHSQGVIHRDIKPENVMLIRRGDDPDFVKVLDFGIARLNWGEQSMATAAGLIFGTARYISPEGAQGEAVGPEGDVYATATLLYQMLAGRTPFEGDQAVALLVQQIHDAPPPLRSIPAAANVPEAIAAVIMTNLSKLPAERAPDARTFGRALVEAAKSVGLTPEDLVPRSSLFVPPGRLSDPGPPMPSVRPALPDRVEDRRRDSQFPEVLAAAVKAVAGGAGAGASQKTQLWNPPAALATLAEAVAHGVAPPPTPPTVASPSPLPGVAPSPEVPRPVYTSNVDRTLDESSDIRAPVDGPPRVKTEPSLPVSLALQGPAPPPTPAMVLTDPSWPVVLPAVPNRPLGGGADHGRPAGPLAALVEEEVVPPRRILGVIVLCLLVGVLGAAAVLYELGMIGAAPRVASADDVVAHADEALKHARWDTPPGDNVRDLTTDGLSKWPREQRLRDIRERATDELVKEAVGRQLARDLPAALHLAHLANELDPSDTTAQHLVEEYERAGKLAGDAALGPSTTAAPVTQPPHGGAPRPTSPAGAAGRVAVEASPPHPRVGQPVTLTAKVSGSSGPAKAIDEPRFVVNGPGFGADTRLEARAGSAGTFSTTFSGFEPGRYEIAFEARVDGAAVRATKTLVMDGEAQLPSVPPSANAPSVPSSVPSGKWL